MLMKHADRRNVPVGARLNSIERAFAASRITPPHSKMTEIWTSRGFRRICWALTTLRATPPAICCGSIDERSPGRADLRHPQSLFQGREVRHTKARKTYCEALAGRRKPWAQRRCGPICFLRLRSPQKPCANWRHILKMVHLKDIKAAATRSMSCSARDGQDSSGHGRAAQSALPRIGRDRV